MGIPGHAAARPPDVPSLRPQPQPEYMCDPKAEAQGAALAADAPYWPQHGNPSVLSREFALIANLFIRHTFDDWMFAESAGRPVRAVMHAAAVVASTERLMGARLWLSFPASPDRVPPAASEHAKSARPFACTDCEHVSQVAVSPWRTVAFRRCYPGVPPPVRGQPEKASFTKTRHAADEIVRQMPG